MNQKYIVAAVAMYLAGSKPALGNDPATLVPAAQCPATQHNPYNNCISDLLGFITINDGLRLHQTTNQLSQDGPKDKRIDDREYLCRYEGVFRDKVHQMFSEPAPCRDEDKNGFGFCARTIGYEFMVVTLGDDQFNLFDVNKSGYIDRLDDCTGDGKITQEDKLLCQAQIEEKK